MAVAAGIREAMGGGAAAGVGVLAVDVQVAAGGLDGGAAAVAAGNLDGDPAPGVQHPVAAAVDPLVGVHVDAALAAGSGINGGPGAGTSGGYGRYRGGQKRRRQHEIIEREGEMFKLLPYNNK